MKLLLKHIGVGLFALFLEGLVTLLVVLGVLFLAHAIGLAVLGGNGS